MTFDPDAYLAKKQGGFDPDAYLEGKGVKPEPVEQPRQPDNDFEAQLLSIPGMKPLSEMAAAANKSIFQMLDFLGPNNINAVMSLLGSDARVPTAEGTLGSEGGYMEEGLARDAVKGLGQALPVAAGMTPVVGRNIASAKGAAEEILGLGSAQISQPVKSIATAVSDALPSKAKDAAKLPLYRQSGEVAAAGFKLDDAGRVVTDAVQKKALKAGIDEGMVAMISAANKPTKRRLRTMVEVLEKGRGSLEYRNFNPPQRVVGDAIKDKLSIIQGANKAAAEQLDNAAASLANESVDVLPAMDNFLGRLAKEGIKFNPNTGAIDFADSSIESLPKAQRIIRVVAKRLRNTADPTNNALRVHNAKKFIDEHVSYGKSQDGLSGRMERIIKDLRHDLDSVLDENFPFYDQVNTTYKETREVIDELQSLAGKKVDLNGENVDKALGVMSRKVLSNYSSGTATEELFKQLDSVASRYSTPLTGGTDDDLFKLVSAEAEIRRMFPSAVKPNTLQGNVGMEIARDAAAGDNLSAAKKAGAAIKSIFSKDDQAKLDALKELLFEKP